MQSDRKHAYLTRLGRTIQAHRIRGDMQGQVSCPHCGIGQVFIVMNYQCAYCRARVTDVCTTSERREKEAQMEMLFGM